MPLVNAAMNVSFDPPGQAKEMTHGILLRVDVLLKWDRWDAPSKRYLRQARKQLLVDKLADDYMGVISPFYDWFRTRDLEVHHARNKSGG